jgi:aminopeptidase I
MVKNGPNSLRNSTSNLSLRPSTAESQATRQHIANLEARIAVLQARDDTESVATTRESARLLSPLPPLFSALTNGEYALYLWNSESQLLSRTANDEYIPSRHSGVSLPLRELSPWAERDVNDGVEEPEKSLFQKYNEALLEQHQKPKRSLITKGLVREGNALKSPEAYTQPFCDFLTENPTVWHAVDYFEKKLEKAGFRKVGSRNLYSWHR